MGKIRPFSLLPFLCFSSFTSPVLAQWDNYVSIFLYFSGNMVAEFNFKGEWGKCTGAFAVTQPCIQPQGAGLHIGNNPSWDSNPFFFAINYSPANQLGADIPYGVDLSSALDMCYESDGKVCAEEEPESLATFSPIELLNVSRANITQIQVGDELGYAVSGTKESTWTGANNPADSLLWFEPPCVFDRSTVFLNYSNPLSFAYSIFFSNSSANATINFDTANATVSLIFNGTREFDGDWYPVDPSIGTIELNTSNPDLPQFQLTNGSQLVWYEQSPGFYEWEVASPNGKANASGNTSGNASGNTSGNAKGNAVAKTWIPWMTALLVPCGVVGFLSFL